jgi:hypothetical protein
MRICDAGPWLNIKKYGRFMKLRRLQNIKNNKKQLIFVKKIFHLIYNIYVYSILFYFH